MFFFHWEMLSCPGDLRSSGFSSCVSAYFFLCTVHRNHVWDYIEGIVVIPMAWAVQCYLSPVMVFCIIVTVRTGQSPVQFTLMVPMRAFPFLDIQSTWFIQWGKQVFKGEMIMNMFTIYFNEFSDKVHNYWPTNTNTRILNIFVSFCTLVQFKLNHIPNGSCQSPYL